MIYGSGSRSDFLIWHITPIGAIWFFLALIWVNLLMSCIMTCKYQRHKVLTVIMIFLIGYLSERWIWLPLSVQSGCVSLPFFCFGFVLNKLENVKESNFFNSKRIFCAIFLWIIDIVFSIKIKSLSLASANFPLFPLDLIGAAAGCYVVLWAFKYIKRLECFKHIFSFLEYYGRNTAIVLSFHLIEQTFIPWPLLLEIMPFHFIAYIVIFLGKLGWSCIWVYIVHHTKRLKKIFV